MMNIELMILNWIQSLRNPLLDIIMLFFTRLGDVGFIWIVLSIILLLKEKTRQVGIMMLIALCLNVLLCNGILKHLFARVRPCDINTSIHLLVSRPTDYSFPSGHTSASFTAVAVLYFMKSKKLFKASLILAVLIAFSRMYLYVHYPSDILGGVVVGMVCGYLAVYLYHKLKIFKPNIFKKLYER